MSTCIRPPRLKKGDAIAVIAPAGPVPEDRLLPSLDLLQSRYTVEYSRRIFAAQGFLAGNDDARAAELVSALSDPRIRAIFCARGGYGVMRILSRLDPSLLSRHPKLIVGFSDITALHAYAQRAGVASIHGPNVTQLAELSAADQAALFDLLDGATGQPFVGLRSIGSSHSVEGPLVGGNLELVRSLLGTPWAFDLRGAVLLLEDVGERPYRIDRALTQLLLSGCLSELAAIVLGDFVRCGEPTLVPTCEDVLLERLAPLGIPVLMGLPIGHGLVNRAIGENVTVRVDGKAGMLTPLQGPAC